MDEERNITLAEAFDLVKELNEKMLDVDGLSFVPHLTLEITNADSPDKEFEGRILFMGDQVWDSFEDSQNLKEIKSLIAEEILLYEENLALIAGRIKVLITKGEW